LKEEDPSFFADTVEALIKIDEVNVFGRLTGILTEIRRTGINDYYDVRNAKIALSKYILQKAASRMPFSTCKSHDLKILRNLEDWEAHFDPDGGPNWSETFSFEQVRSKAADALSSRSWLRPFWRK
jgi:hypothetical protein